MVGHRGLGPEAPTEGGGGVVGPLRRGQDVGQGLPHVGEGGGAVPADVGPEARGAEPGGQGHGGPDHHRRAPQDHEGIAVEQRHGAVGDVAPVEPVGLGRAHGDGGQPTLGAAHRLGSPGRARGEQQQVEILGCRSGRRHHSDGIGTAVGRHQAGVPGEVDTEHPFRRHAEVESVEECGPFGVGDQHPAVGASHVTGQRVAATGGVDPHHHRTAQGRGTEPEEVLGHVAEEDTDVAGPGRRPTLVGVVRPVEPLPDERRPVGAGRHHLAPRPHGVLEAEPGVVVLGPGQKELGHAGIGPGRSFGHGVTSTNRLRTARPMRPSSATMGATGVWR